ncbi:hypothetical protein ACSMXM_03490 [Pacificimonas sp. ICDLI1SI03]
MTRTYVRWLGAGAALMLLAGLPTGANAQEGGDRSRSERSAERGNWGDSRDRGPRADGDRRDRGRFEGGRERSWRDARGGDHRDDRDRYQSGRHDKRGDRNDNWRGKHYDRGPQRQYLPPRVIVRPRPSYIYRPHFWGSDVFRWDDRYRDYGYVRDYRPGYGYFGPTSANGWRVLHPWLKDDPAGRHWVMWQFDNNRDGRLTEAEAGRANRAFERLADYDRDRQLSRREIDEGLYELRDEYRYAFR